MKTRQAHVDANLEEIMVCGDATQLGQVVTNLLINAVEHSPVGVHVTVTLKRESQEVCLTVADTGPGIAAEHLPHLFDRFYRVDQDRSRESGGSGLGLSIVQAIVRSHGGVIEVQSEPGKGTEFKVKLPVCDDADRSGKLPAANSSPAENS